MATAVTVGQDRRAGQARASIRGTGRIYQANRGLRTDTGLRRALGFVSHIFQTLTRCTRVREQPVRFAFKTANQSTTWPDVIEVWRAADQIEVFESGWNFDHFYPIDGNAGGPCLEGWTMLAALAQATSRLRMGTMVTGIHYRHPAVLANMIATLDIISSGRLEVGIGAGWNQDESGAYGIELGTPRERSDRFEEACEVLVGLLSEPTFSFQGRYYQLTGALNEPKGPQRPHPPICIGGGGGEADAAHRGALRPALELRRRHPGGVRP